MPAAVNDLNALNDSKVSIMGAQIATKQQMPLAETTHRAESGQYLTFTLAGETFAIRILHVKEIIEYGTLTEVPMMPSFVRGVINLRGSVVPVVDLSARFGKGSTPIVKRTGIVIVEPRDEDRHTHQDIGIIVDSVNEVVEIGGDEIEPPPSFGAGIRQDFISGMAKRNDRFIILLNADKVLSVDEISAISRTSQLENTYA